MADGTCPLRPPYCEVEYDSHASPGSAQCLVRRRSRVAPLKSHRMYHFPTENPDILHFYKHYRTGFATHHTLLMTAMMASIGFMLIPGETPMFKPVELTPLTVPHRTSQLFLSSLFDPTHCHCRHQATEVLSQMTNHEMLQGQSFRKRFELCLH